MSSLFGLAEQVLASAAGGSSSESGAGHAVHKAGGYEYNSPHYGQQPQGGYSTHEVLAHADVGEEDQGYIAKAIQHVHSNPEQHRHQVDEGDLAKYGPMILSAISSLSSKSGSKSGLDVSSLLSGGLGEGGGNQLMGLVMNQVGKNCLGGGAEKQSFMNGAAMTLTKLVAQKQLSAFIGGSNSGGLSMLEIGETLLKSRFG